MKRLIPAALMAAFALHSCDTTAPLVQVQTENVDAVPTKVAELTEDQLKSWDFQDLLHDTIPGMSVDKTYTEIIKNKTGKTVVVGVVDSGVDIEHEDLDGVIWTNEDEIPNNGKDDDNNGYIDDVHGWNFLGNIEAEQLEMSRIIQKYDPIFKGKTLDQIAAKDKEMFKTYTAAREEYDKEYQENQQQLQQYQQIVQFVEQAHKLMSEELGKEDYTKDELAKQEFADPMMIQAKNGLMQMFEYEDSIPKFLESINEGITSLTSRLNDNLNLDGHYRDVLGDDPDDIKDVTYGDNNVMGPTAEGAMHGTHVAGIIAAERTNGIGANGVANNVKIMTVRAVPDGDERDKDIALALRYAVDNGAKVINTSFGKYYATHPEWVYDAIKYAAKKDVLIVNAAGNESYDLDGGKTVYPNDQLADNIEFADNVITIGALNDVYSGDLIAPFSNYGKSNVDIFAPGMKIWSTIPENKYRFLQGTSMAAPEVAGVAAMLRSYYPQFSAAQIKQIIMQSGTTSNMMVILGGEPDNTRKFSEISKSGKMVNMYNAFKMAELSSQNQ